MKNEMSWTEVQEVAYTRGITIRMTLGPITSIRWPDGSVDENIMKGHASRKVRAWLEANPQTSYHCLRDVRTNQHIAWTDGREVYWTSFERKARRWDTLEEVNAVIHALYLNGHDYIGTIDVHVVNPRP